MGVQWGGAITQGMQGAAAGGQAGGGWGALGGGIAGAILGGLDQNGPDHSNYIKHAIEMRVRDAKAAGIHPLYALGASGMYSPVLNASEPSSVGADIGRALFESAPENKAKADSGIEAAQIRSLDAAAARDNAAADYARWQVLDGTRRALQTPEAFTVTPTEVHQGGGRGDPATMRAPDEPAFQNFRVGDQPEDYVRLPAKGSGHGFMSQLILDALGWIGYGGRKARAVVKRYIDRPPSPKGRLNYNAINPFGGLQ